MVSEKNFRNTMEEIAYEEINLKSYIKTVLLYGYESWNLTSKSERNWNQQRIDF